MALGTAVDLVDSLTCAGFSYLSVLLKLGLDERLNSCQRPIPQSSDEELSRSFDRVVRSPGPLVHLLPIPRYGNASLAWAQKERGDPGFLR